MDVQPLVVDWLGLKKMGWCYSRAHTHRLMQAEIPDPAQSNRSHARLN